ncbi:MAG: hypothetical protein MUC48_01245 [Leptolyngbya sp. Prado105]|nr:hypothetical protein [Leptolyngbya sp. Prado105]
MPCRLGCRGIEEILELKLSESELKALHISAASVQQNLDRANQLLAATV